MGAKRGFHHGDLREALIAAVRELLIERGPEGFVLTDACRRVGVSTAAPYRHFSNKREILEEIVTRAFEELTVKNARAIADSGRGTVAGITALGITYLEFAVAQPAVFRLMFGELKKAGTIRTACDRCLKNVIEEVAYLNRTQGDGRSEEIALRLWTFVHGAAALLIDGDYRQVAPGLDVRAMIADVTPRLLEISRSK